MAVDNSHFQFSYKPAISCNTVAFRFWIGKFSVLILLSRQQHPEDGEGVSPWNDGERSHPDAAVYPRRFWRKNFARIIIIYIECKFTLQTKATYLNNERMPYNNVKTQYLNYRQIFKNVRNSYLSWRWHIVLRTVPGLCPTSGTLFRTEFSDQGTFPFSGENTGSYILNWVQQKVLISVLVHW